MVLFINPISDSIELLIIDVEHGEVRHTSTIPKWRDYDEFPDAIVDTIDRHDIDTIWCITGPWAFTRMRIVTLTLNTLKLARDITLKWCHFFDIIDTPSPILRANDREYIMKESDTSTYLVSKFDIPAGTYTGYGDRNDFTEEKKLIQYTYTTAHVMRVFMWIEASSSLLPIYLKDPHITWSRQRTHPSSENRKK
jgi:hypothetical protein